LILLKGFAPFVPYLLENIRVIADKQSAGLNIFDKINENYYYSAWLCCWFVID